MNYFLAKFPWYILLLLIICSGCSIQKEDNLSVFLRSKNIIFNKNYLNSDTKINDTLVLNLSNKSFSVAFWMESYNYSKNGVIFSLLNDYDDELKQSLITLFLSKKRLSIISNNKDYRRHNKSFKQDFSENFLNRQILQLSEKYYISCLFDAENNQFSIYVDGKLYCKEIIDLNVISDKTYLKIGYTTDNSKRKYYYKGNLDNLYFFPTLLNEDELNLLMNLTITNNYPLE